MVKMIQQNKLQLQEDFGYNDSKVLGNACQSHTQVLVGQ